jgi:guanylate kinase
MAEIQKTYFYVVSGPSGSGKTSICRQIAAKYDWYYSVSHTTRTRRENEINEQDYYFISTDEFKTMLDAQKFYEWAEVYGNYYGTAIDTIKSRLDKGVSVIADVDTQGAAQIKKKNPEAVSIFIETPGIDELRKRLVQRGRDSSDEIQRRIKQAKAELAQKTEYDHIILNDDFDDALKKFDAIIQQHTNGSK